MNRTTLLYCRSCTVYTPLESFANSRGLLSPNCRSCRVQAGREHNRLRLAVIQRYGGKCVQCDESDPAVLQLDHIKPISNSRRKRVSSSVMYRRKLARSNRDPNLQVLCANCHARKTYKDNSVSVDVCWKKYVKLTRGNDRHTSAREDFRIRLYYTVGVGESCDANNVNAGVEHRMPQVLSTVATMT